MKRAKLVLLAGACVTAAGAFVMLRADSLATRWQPLGGGAWGGTTDPALRQSYQQLGLVGLCLGAALLALAAWAWLAGRRGDAPDGRAGRADAGGEPAGGARRSPMMSDAVWLCGVAAALLLWAAVVGAVGWASGRTPEVALDGRLLAFFGLSLCGWTGAWLSGRLSAGRGAAGR
jgi:hypothetical protein